MVTEATSCGPDLGAGTGDRPARADHRRHAHEAEPRDGHAYDSGIVADQRDESVGSRSRLMGIYSRLIFHRLCDWAMRCPSITRLRREALSEADEEILETGFGTGLNLEHYPERVRRLTAVDPGVGMS